MAAYNRISLSQLVQRMTERLGDNAVFWQTPEKKYALNEAIRMWAVMTGQWTVRISLPAQAGQIFYDVPRQIVSVQRMKFVDSGVFGSTTTLMYQTSLAELDFGIPHWQEPTSFGTPQLWAPVGLNKVAIYPFTASSVGGLWFEGIALAPYMIGNDNINIGDEEVNRILDYAHHYCAFKESGLEFDETQPLMENFAGACVQRNQRLLATGIFRNYLGESKDEQQRPPRTPSAQPGARI